MVDLHLFAFNCNESFRIVVDKKEKRAKLFCLTLSISLFYLECFRINLLGPPDAYSNRAELHPVFSFDGCKGRDFILNSKTFPIKIHCLQDQIFPNVLVDTHISYLS